MTTIIELVLMALLAITLIYCIMLERRLAALRLGQETLKTTIGALDEALINAGAALRALKATASDAADTLDGRLASARVAIGELSRLTAADERAAARIDRSTPGGVRLDGLRAAR